MILTLSLTNSLTSCISFGTPSNELISKLSNVNLFALGFDILYPVAIPLLKHRLSKSFILLTALSSLLYLSNSAIS